MLKQNREELKKFVLLACFFILSSVLVNAQMDGVGVDSWSPNPNGSYKIIRNSKELTKDNASIKRQAIVITNNGKITNKQSTISLPQSQWLADVTVNIHTLKSIHENVIKRIKDVIDAGANLNGYNSSKLLNTYIDNLPNDNTGSGTQFNEYIKDNYSKNNMSRYRRNSYRNNYLNRLSNLFNQLESRVMNNQFTNSHEWRVDADYSKVNYSNVFSNYTHHTNSYNNSFNIRKQAAVIKSYSYGHRVSDLWVYDRYYFSNLTIYKSESIIANVLSIENSLINILNPNENVFQSTGSEKIDVKIKKSSSLFFDLNNSKNYILYINELSSNSNVTEKNIGRVVTIVSEGEAVFENSRIEAVRALRFDGSVKSLFNLDLINTKYGLINNTGGPIHRFGINIPSANINTSVLNGTSSFYDWNTVDFDYSKINFKTNTSKYYQGYTASFKFLNHEDESPVNDVLIVYSDDRNNPGVTKTKLAHFVTHNDGLMYGTYDSKTGVNSTDKKRPTLYVLTKQVSNQGTVEDTVMVNLDIKSYLHQPIPREFGISAEFGKIKPDETVKDYYDYHLKTDDNISNTNYTEVLGYSKIDSSDQLYDILKAKWREYEGIEEYPLLKAKGGILYLEDGWNLSVDKNAGPLCDVNTTTKTITVRANVIKKTDRFNRLICSEGNIKLLNNANIDFPYTDSVRNSYVRIINLAETDRITVKYENNTLFKEYSGEFGFPYKSRDEKFRLIVDLHTGVEALKLYDLNNIGIDNTFSIGFEEENKLFKIADRKILNSLQDSIINEVETEESLLPIHDALIKYINKKVQEPIK